MDEMEALPRHSRGLVCEPTLLRTAYPLLCSTAVFVRAAYSLVGLPGQTLYLEPMVGRRDASFRGPSPVIRRPHVGVAAEAHRLHIAHGAFPHPG